MNQELSEIHSEERALQKHQEIVKAKQILSLSYLKLGKLLADMRDSGDFKEVLGEDLSQKKGAWSLYLSLPEVSIAPSTARGLILIYKKFIKELGLSENQIQQIDRRKLQALLPAINQENYQDWIEKAKTFSRADLFKELKQRDFSLAEIQECNHQLIKGIYFKCKVCGEIFFDELPSKYESVEEKTIKNQNKTTLAE